MTDDLVKRLEEEAECYRGTTQACLLEAANEIKRLKMVLEAGGGRYWEDRYRDEAAMVDKLQAALINITATAPFGEPQEIARIALGEKKDGVD